MEKLKLVAELVNFGTKEQPAVKELKLNSSYHSIYVFKNKHTKENPIKHPYLDDTYAQILISHDNPILEEKRERIGLYCALANFINYDLLKVNISKNDEIKLNLLFEKYTSLEDNSDEILETESQIAEIAEKYIDLEIENSLQKTA
jgi:hypothetical protein